MRNTRKSKINDGYGNGGNMMMDQYYPQNNNNVMKGHSYFGRFKPQQIKRVYGKTSGAGAQTSEYMLPYDDSVPDLGLTKQIFNEFRRMEKYYRADTKLDAQGNVLTNQATSVDDATLKKIIMLKALGTDDNYIDAYREEQGIPKSNNRVNKILCNYYAQNFNDSNDEFKYWLGRVLKAYTTHEYPGVTTKDVLALVAFYLVKCHESVVGDMDNLEEWYEDPAGNASYKNLIKTELDKFAKRGVVNRRQAVFDGKKRSKSKRRRSKSRSMDGKRRSKGSKSKSRSKGGKSRSKRKSRSKSRSKGGKSRSKSRSKGGKSGKRRRRSKSRSKKIIENMMAEMGMKPKRHRRRSRGKSHRKM